MKPYQTSNKITRIGLAWLLMSSIVSGGAIGGIVGFVSLWVYLIVLFPAVMAFLAAGAMNLAIRQGKVRNPAIAALFGGLTGLIIFGTIHTIEYQQFKYTIAEEITKEIGRVSDRQSNQIIDNYLQEQTGATGFFGYLKYAAKVGVTFTRVESYDNRSKGGMNLGETGTWIYWLTEMGIVSIWIALAAHSSAKDPFCENSNQWYGNKERLGSVNPQLSTNFLNRLQSDNYSEAGKLVDQLQGVNAPSLEVYIQRSPDSSSFSDLVLTVDDISLDSKGNLQSKEVAQGMISINQYNKFQESVTASLYPNPEKRVTISNKELYLAQLERTNISAKDEFEPHGLSTSEESNIIQQLESLSQIKEAYLVRKTIQLFPEKPFYVLGIIRRIGAFEFESEEAAYNLRKKLMTELTLPIQTRIIFLNKDKAMTKILQQTAGKSLYPKK